MKRLFNYLFALDLGYFIKDVWYSYEGEMYVGYVICRGYRFFGIFGYDRVSHCFDMNEVNKTLTRLNIVLINS
jgi:hypothetical protein